MEGCCGNHDMVLCTYTVSLQSMPISRISPSQPGVNQCLLVFSMWCAQYETRNNIHNALHDYDVGVEFSSNQTDRRLSNWWQILYEMEKRNIWSFIDCFIMGLYVRLRYSNVMFMCRTIRSTCLVVWLTKHQSNTNTYGMFYCYIVDEEDESACLCNEFRETNKNCDWTKMLFMTRWLDYNTYFSWYMSLLVWQ
jgi:hypothetical protein